MRFQLLGQYGVQLFPAVNLVSLLAMVFIFVCLLNAQSKMDKPLSEPQARVWAFFRGEGAKRTRSIRKLISSVRGSIRRRGSRYRRLNAQNQHLQHQALSPSTAPVRSYRSMQSRRLQHHTSIDEDAFSSVIETELPSQS